MNRIVGKFDSKNIENTVRLLNIGCEKRGDWYNCMGYALGIKDWLFPIEEDYEYYGNGRADLITETRDDNHWTEEEVGEYFLNRDAQAICEQYGFRKATPQEIKNSKVDLIGFREGIHWGKDIYSDREDDVCIEEDFHFRKRVDGIWSEKMGSGPIRIVTDEEVEEFNEHWRNFYFGDIVYLVKEN